MAKARVLMLMLLVQEPRLGGNSLTFADKCRKGIAKKQGKIFEECEKEFFNNIEKQNLSTKLAHYVWDVLLKMQRGYSFNRSHCLAYSLIALQEMNLAYKYPLIFWDCANLIVDSGTIEGIDDKSTNYDKISKAVNKITTATNTEVSLIDINQSEMSFTPSVEENRIYYGMGGLQGVNNDIAQEIIAKRPYTSLNDFMNKVKCNKTVMISLIKSGAFDQFDERKKVMEKYIWSTCKPKKRITMQNFAGIIKYKLLPQYLDFQRRVFNFNKSLKKFCKQGENFILDQKHYNFYHDNFDDDLLNTDDNGNIVLSAANWKKLYDKSLVPAKNWVSSNKDSLLEQLNNAIFMEEWSKYAGGNYSSWEMTSLGYYYHEHELSNIDDLYNIVEYRSLPEEPIIEHMFKKGGKEIPIFKTYRIMGTVIAKDDMKSTVTILTPESGIVDVKFNREYYAMYNRQLSKLNPDGTKQVIESSWFKRGSLIMVNGFKRGNMFVTKSYKKSNSHQLYKITEVNGTRIEFTHLRAGETEE